MTTARRVLDWDGRNADGLARQVVGLPAGRYVLVPESELAPDHGLTAEVEDGLLDAIASLDRGAGIPADLAFAELRAQIERAR